MSEEILKALAQLYAIVSKQDLGASALERAYVQSSFKKKLSLDAVKEYVALYDSFVGYQNEKVDQSDASADESTTKKEKLTSVKDSVKTLGICRKINKTLSQKQKIIVLIELLEMVKANQALTPQRMQIIHTVADAFNIEKYEYNELEDFVLNSDASELFSKNILIVNNQADLYLEIDQGSKHLFSEFVDETIIFLKVISVDMIFMRSLGQHEFTLNSKKINSNEVLLFSPGSILKTYKGVSFYYSEIVSNFTQESSKGEIEFVSHQVEYKFPNGAIGLRNINIAENGGQLIGIMGASGAGKTTLLNLLAGIENPSQGSVLLNGINIHKDKENVKGAFGYVVQDDLLIEELSVFENLYYNTKFCFKDLTETEIVQKVDNILSNLGLLHIRNLTVGNFLNKKISGGQRKRLNIALELIREPLILFVDEPTSGLSSRDSENVIDLLKELSVKGTLIFVVIHQPSSDIYKVFDKMYILDVGGYMIFNGHPVEAITYFKKISNQADSEHGQCDACGNVNVEQLFNIIEEKVVDEFGNYSNNRKITPPQWHEFYNQNIDSQKNKLKSGIQITKPKLLENPSKLKQWLIYLLRDVKSKISNKQYMIINVLEASVLAFILSIIIRHSNHTGDGYVFRYNDNIPAYILMSIVVALFIGLSISAEEIIKDKKILKREALLNLSRGSYLYSKISILFIFSAFQSFTFVLVGNSILEIKSMTFQYWFVLWSVACSANVLGLLISSAFNSAITVYILIPLLLIPQMILSGAMFNFDKINKLFGSKEATPVMADFVTSRWAFEALAVAQFKDNQYQTLIFKNEQVQKIADFNLVYLLPELKDKLLHKPINKNDIALISNEMLKQAQIFPQLISNEDVLSLQSNHANPQLISKIHDQIEAIEEKYKEIFNKSSQSIDEQIEIMESNGIKSDSLKNIYFNDALADLLTNATIKNKFIINDDNQMISKTNPIYFNSQSNQNVIHFRTHFYTPYKALFGQFIDTFWFNILIIWSITLFFFMLLYFDLVRRLIENIASRILK
jgi:ABC-type multidrug transport system ATPase subunit